jgi:hypothetical protein
MTTSPAFLAWTAAKELTRKTDAFELTVTGGGSKGGRGGKRGSKNRTKKGSKRTSSRHVSKKKGKRG